VDTRSVLGLPTLRPAFLDDLSSSKSRATNPSGVTHDDTTLTTRDNHRSNATIGSLLIGGGFMLHYDLEDDLDPDPEDDDEDEDLDEDDDDLDDEGGDDDDDPETWQVSLGM
jgi:hypothetical protein